MNELLDRCVAKRPKNGIDSGLVARALSLEPFQHVLIDTKRNCRLWRLQLQPSTDNATHNVAHLCLRVVGRRCALAGAEASEVSLGLG